MFKKKKLTNMLNFLIVLLKIVIFVQKYACRIKYNELCRNLCEIKLYLI